MIRSSKQLRSDGMASAAYAAKRDVTDALYEAAVGAAAWSGAIGDILADVGGVQALMIEADLGAGTHVHLGAAGAINEEAAALCQAEHALNPWTPAEPPPSGRAITMSSLIPLRDLERTAFYADVLGPSDLAFGAATFVRTGPERWVGWGFGRSRQQGDYSARDLAVLEAYAPHVARAIALARRSDGLALVRRGDLSALDGLSPGTVLVDEAGRVLLANRAAMALEAEGALRLSQDGAACRDAAAAAAFSAAVADALAGAAPAPVRFRGKSGAVFALVATPLGSRAADRLAEAGARRPAAALFVFSSKGAPAAPPARLQDLFGFTPAEARVAAEMALGDGEAEIAGRLGIGLNSLKTHRRRIYDKAGVSRQAQLVRLVSRLPDGG
jgi:DNA-binding CsgD family transcriptional regulator